MSDRFKKIYLLISIVGSFLVYMIYYYYNTYFDKAAYRFRDFKYIEISHIKNNDTAYYFNSAENKLLYRKTINDSLISISVKLDSSDLKQIHNAMWKVNFWDIETADSNTLYTLKVCYTEKCKEVKWGKNTSSKYINRLSEVQKEIEYKIKGK